MIDNEEAQRSKRDGMVFMVGQVCRDLGLPGPVVEIGHYPEIVLGRRRNARRGSAMQTIMLPDFLADLQPNAFMELVHDTIVADAEDLGLQLTPKTAGHLRACADNHRRELILYRDIHLTGDPSPMEAVARERGLEPRFSEAYGLETAYVVDRWLMEVFVDSRAVRGLMPVQLRTLMLLADVDCAPLSEPHDRARARSILLSEIPPTALPRLRDALDELGLRLPFPC